MVRFGPNGERAGRDGDINALEWYKRWYSTGAGIEGHIAEDIERRRRSEVHVQPEQARPAVRCVDAGRVAKRCWRLPARSEAATGDKTIVGGTEFY